MSSIWVKNRVLVSPKLCFLRLFLLCNLDNITNLWIKALDFQKFAVKIRKNVMKNFTLFFFWWRWAKTPTFFVVYEKIPENEWKHHCLLSFCAIKGIQKTADSQSKFAVKFAVKAIFECAKTVEIQGFSDKNVMKNKPSLHFPSKLVHFPIYASNR